MREHRHTQKMNLSIQISFYIVLHMQIKQKFKEKIMSMLTDSKAWSHMQVCCGDCDDSLTRL